MATAHIIYVIHKRRTSSSWGSVAELIALSQNSQPEFDVLANTGGGIKSCRTFLQMAKIRVRKIPGLPNHDHVELVFEDSGSPDHQRNASEHELDELHSNWPRHFVTWPQNTTKIPADTDMDAWSMSTSAERLTRVPVDSREAMDIVWPNRRYG